MDFSWSSFSRHDVVVVAVVVVVMEVVVSCFKDFYFNVRYLGKMNLFPRIYQFFRWVGSTTARLPFKRFHDMSDDWAAKEFPPLRCFIRPHMSIIRGVLL